MRRLIIAYTGFIAAFLAFGAAIVLTLSLAFPCYGNDAYFVYFKKKAAAGVGYSDVLFYWGAENSLDSDKPSGGSKITATGQGGGSQAFSTTQKAVGSYSVYIPTSGSSYIFSVTSNNIFDNTQGAMGFYFYGNVSQATDYAGQLQFDASDNRGNDHVGFYLYNGCIEVEWVGNGANHKYVNTQALSDNTWYFIELRYDKNKGLSGANSMEMYVNGSISTGTTPTNSDTLPAFSQAIDEMWVGSLWGFAVIEYLDQILVSNSSTRNLYLIRDGASF